MQFGVDVSKYQGTIDWAKAKADGLSFAVCKASLGLEVDPEYAGKVAGARKAGLIPGAYHYLYPGVDPAKAVDLFLSTIGPTDGMLVMLDVESNGYGTDAQTFAAVKAWVAEFRKRVPAHPLLIYTGGWFWSGHMGNPNGSGLGLLWQSHYVTVADPPEPYRTVYARVPSSWWTPGYGGWHEATFLQFTSSGEVDGYTGRLDTDAFRGTKDDLLALTRDLPDTSTGSDTVDSFPVPKVPSVGDLAAGKVLYTSTALDVSDPDRIILDPGRTVPFLGAPAAGVRVVEYVDEQGVHSGKAYFIHATDLANVRAIVTDDGITQATVDAAVAAQKASDAAALTAAVAAQKATDDAALAAQKATDAAALKAATDKVAVLTSQLAAAEAKVAENAAAATALGDAKAAWSTLDARLR